MRSPPSRQRVELPGMARGWTPDPHSSHVTMVYSMQMQEPATHCPQDTSEGHGQTTREKT